MSAFHFRLATLLRLREAMRDKCRVDLAEARRADDDLRDNSNDSAWNRSGSKTDVPHGRRPGAVDVDELVEAHRYAAALRAQEEKLRQKRQTLAAEIDRRRQALLAADRDVKVLEKLRSCRQAQHRLEEERQSAKQLDEAALQAVGRLVSRGGCAQP